MLSAHSISIKKSTIGRLIFIVALALILFFVLHGVIPHDHPHELFGSGIQATLHGNDKKYWYLMLLAFIFVATDLIKRWRFDTGAQQKFSLAPLGFRIDIAKLFNPILQALRTGILNPKLYH